MARKPDTEQVYAAAALFKQRCFVDHVSFLWPEEKAWGRETIDQLYAAMVDHPDEGPGKFLDKLRLQLLDCSADVHRVAADLMVLYELFPDYIGTKTKVATVESAAGDVLADDPPEVNLTQLFAHAVGSTGPRYVAAQYFAFLYYLDFARSAIVEGIDVSDPNAVEQLADAVESRRTKAIEARNILLHLFFPDLYDPIVGGSQKRKLVKLFKQHAGTESNIDAALREIRAALSPEFGEGFNWYAPEILLHWNPPPVLNPTSEAVAGSELGGAETSIADLEPRVCGGRRISAT